MNLWKLSYPTAHSGLQLRWTGTYKEAVNWRRQMVKDFGPSMGPDTIDPVLIPTSKSGLLVWLNVNVTTDNG